MRTWLEATRQLDLSEPRLRILAQKLTQSLQTVPGRAAAIHSYVRRMPFVPSPRPSRTRASKVLARGQGDAYAKGVLFVALCRAADIPSRLVVAKVPDPGERTQSLHLIAQVEIGGSWVSTDAFIVDPLMFAAAKHVLRAEGADSGWGIVADAPGLWDGRSHCIQQFHAEDAVSLMGPYDDVDDVLAGRAKLPTSRLHDAFGWVAARIAQWRIRRLRLRARAEARAAGLAA